MELFTLGEVAKKLKVSRTTLWRLRSAGYIRSIELGGITRIRQADLDRFISEESKKGRDRWL